MSKSDKTSNSDKNLGNYFMKNNNNSKNKINNNKQKYDKECMNEYILKIKNKTYKKVNELTNIIKRQIAEFDNFRRRTKKEKDCMYEIGVCNVIEKILPIIDSFERALLIVSKKDKQNPFVNGIIKIYKQMNNILKKIGIQQIKSVGENFDPNYHNAVMCVENKKNMKNKSNTIIEEFQKGYIYKNHIIRHSMVKVIK